MRWSRGVARGISDPNRARPPDGSTDRSFAYRLMGSMLISVMFIKDYLILTFEVTAEDGMLIDSPQLTCMSWPRVARANVILAFGSPGYRDALCDLIDARVTAVRDDVASGIQLSFDGPALVLRPTPEETTGPEIATLVFPGTNEWGVWSVGEGAFEYLRETRSGPA